MSDVPRPVDFWDIDRLKTYARNAKKHPPEQIKKLAAAIRRFGWTAPIVVDGDGVIIAGHGRRLAAIELGMRKVPVIVRADLNAEEADAMRLADNRVASTEYDQHLVQEELARLHELNFEMEAIGFDERELQFLTADLAEMDGSLFVEDIGTAVNERKEQNDAVVAETDKVEISVGEVLGFKKVTVADSRKIRGFLAALEARAGKKGVSALIWHIEQSEAA